MQRVNAIAEPQFFFLTAPETITNEWNKLTEAAISECLDRNAKVLVVDTIGQLARMPGDSENNAGDALTVLQPLQRAASKGLGVVIIRHERKSGGDVGDSGRGSTAFGGAVDTIISIRRPDGNSRLTLRELRAVSRFDGVPDSLLVDLEPDGYSVRERGDLVAEAAEKAVHDFLAKRATSGATEEEIVEATEMPRATVKRALRALPGVTMTGKGVRNEAYRFVLNANN